MSQAGEKDAPHQRLDKIQDDIEDAKVTADDLAHQGLINPEEVEDTDPAAEAPRPRG